MNRYGASWPCAAGPDLWNRSGNDLSGTGRGGEAKPWNPLHYVFDDVRRVNHEEAYGDGDACTNQAESFFSRIRRPNSPTRGVRSVLGSLREVPCLSSMMYGKETSRGGIDPDMLDQADQPFDGATCRAARALLGVSQEELCMDAGCGRQLLADLENGMATPKPSKLADLREALERRGAMFGSIGDVVLVGARRSAIAPRSARARGFARDPVRRP